MLKATAITDWDKAYSNQGYIANSAKIFSRWDASSKALKASTKADLDLSYGPNERQKLDIFYPDHEPKGLFVFIHGGYWHSFDKNAFSFCAQGMLAQGYAVAIPSYDLCPTVSIATITDQIAESIEFSASKVAGPIYLAGHSAGGHLVGRMNSQDSKLSGQTYQRITRSMAISPVADLRPLLKTAMNDKLRLDAQSALENSVIFHEPKADADIICWVGAAERPEFLRQNQMMFDTWRGLCSSISHFEQPNQNHFTVLDGLMDKDSTCLRVLLGL